MKLEFHSWFRLQRAHTEPGSSTVCVWGRSSVHRTHAPKSPSDKSNFRTYLSLKNPNKFYFDSHNDGKEAVRSSARPETGERLDSTVKNLQLGI